VTATSSAPKVCNAASAPPRAAEHHGRVGDTPDAAQPKIDAVGFLIKIEEKYYQT